MPRLRSGDPPTYLPTNALVRTIEMAEEPEPCVVDLAGFVGNGSKSSVDQAGVPS
jgi:hypothetical protein